MEQLLKLEHVSKSFGDKEVLKDISFHINKSEILGIIGESGSGKSTLAKLITLQFPLNKGSITFMGKDITSLDKMSLKEYYKEVQMIYQQARTSFNPRLTIGYSLGEGVQNLLGITDKDKNREMVLAALNEVNLPASYYDKKPQDMSGGECQRAAIARALLVKPKMLICDEATSDLDVSVQANIIHLLMDLKEKYEMAIFFITHDLALTSCFCDRAVILKNGVIAEELKASEIACSTHPYTRELLDAMLG